MKAYNICLFCLPPILDLWYPNSLWQTSQCLQLTRIQLRILILTSQIMQEALFHRYAVHRYPIHILRNPPLQGPLYSSLMDPNYLLKMSNQLLQHPPPLTNVAPASFNLTDGASQITSLVKSATDSVVGVFTARKSNGGAIAIPLSSA